MKIIDVRWFTAIKCVGIVKVDDPFDGIKYYIGVAHGEDEERDKQFIADFGAKFPKDVGDKLFQG